MKAFFKRLAEFLTMRTVLCALPVACVIFVLAGGGLWWYAGQLHKRAQAAVLTNAQERWEQRPFEDYRYQKTRIVNNDTVHVRRLRSTDHDVVLVLFEEIAVYPEIATRQPFCPQPILICHHRKSHIVDVLYDPQLGYPRRVVFTDTASPDWLNPQFWWLFVQHEWWSQCRTWNCTNSFTEVVTIDQLEPLPTSNSRSMRH